MATYQEIQAQMQSQMQEQRSGNSEVALKDSAKQMSKAAQNLQMTSMSQNQQTLSITQAIQAQQQSIQSLSMSINTLANNMSGGGGVGPGPIQPAMSSPQVRMGPSGNTFLSGVGNYGSLIGGMALNNVRQSLHQNITQPLKSIEEINVGLMGGMQQGAQPGFLNVPGRGMLRSFSHGLGEGYRPENAMSYTLGASQASFHRQAGHGAAGFAQGVLGNLGAAGADFVKSSIGATIGQALIPIPFVGGMIGSAVAGSAPDPFTYAMEEVSRMNALGGGAARDSYKFLRGGTMGGRRIGSMGIEQEASIGRGIARDTFMDLTYTTQDINQLQSMFAQSGHMMGANDPQKYVKKFRELLDTHKNVAKVLQMSTAEAAEFMNTIDYGTGLNARNQIGRAYAAAHIGGMSPGQVASMMQSGARGFANMGLTAPTGALAMQASIGTAGAMHSSGNVSNSMFATLGGEQGMRDVLQRAQGQFLSGTGGMMALFNQPGQGTLSQRLNRAASSMGNTGDMLNYLANSDQMIEDMMKERGPSGMQSEMLAEIYRYAKELDGKATGAKLRNLMIISAQSLGYAKTQTEAKMLIESIPEVKKSISQSQQAANQASADMARDLAGERFGAASVKIFGRQVARATGATDIAESVSRFSANMGQRFENFSRSAANKAYGINEVKISGDMYDEIMNTSESQRAIDLGVSSAYGLNRGSSEMVSDLDEKLMGLTMGFQGLGNFYTHTREFKEGQAPGPGVKAKRRRLSSRGQHLGANLRGGGYAPYQTFGNNLKTNTAFLALDHFRRTGKVFDVYHDKSAKIEALKAAGYDVDPTATSGARSFEEIMRRENFAHGDIGKRNINLLHQIGASDKAMQMFGLDKEQISTLSEAAGSKFSIEKTKSKDARYNSIRSHLGINIEMDPDELISSYNEPLFQKFLKELQNLLSAKGTGNVQTASRLKKELDGTIEAMMSKGDPSLRTLVLEVLKKNDYSPGKGEYGQETFNIKAFTLERPFDVASPIESKDLGKFAKEERGYYRREAVQALATKGVKRIANMAIGEGALSNIQFGKGDAAISVGAEFLANKESILENLRGDDSELASSLRSILSDKQTNADVGRAISDLAIDYGGGAGRHVTGKGTTGADGQIGTQSAAKLSEFISTQTKILETIAGDLGVK